MTEQVAEDRPTVILQTLRDYINQNEGRAPSTRELIDLTGYSFGSLAYHLKRLESEGKITRNYKMARSIRLT